MLANNQSMITGKKLLLNKKSNWHKTLTKINRQKSALLMILPTILLVIVFQYVPMAGWWIAFTKFKIGKSIFTGDFVGLYHFKRVFQDSSDYGYLLRNTLVINCTSIVLNLFVAITLSVLMKEIIWKRGAKIVQTVSFFPHFVSVVIIYSLAWSLFSVNSGAINQFLVKVGLREKGFNLLGLPQYSWGLMIGINAWKHTGYNCIIFLAAISGIPQEQYESADIDGANRFQKIRHITLPYLVPTMCVLLILNSGGIFNSSLPMYFMFTNSTNWERMEVLDMYIYKFGLQLLDYSYATAVGIIKTFVGLAMMFATNGLAKKYGKTSII